MSSLVVRGFHLVLISSVPSQQTMEIPNDDHDAIGRKVKALLNKLTMRNFRSIVEQITALVNGPQDEEGQRILQSVVQLIFEQAMTDAPSAERYARLCHWIMEHFELRVQDGESTGGGDESVGGGELIKACVLKQYDKEFKHKRHAVDSSEGALKPSDDYSKVDLNERHQLDAKTSEGRKFALIKFIGQLFKLQIIPPQIIHDCIEALLSDSDRPEEDAIESLCSLLTTIGSMLDTPEARPDIDAYFVRMDGFTKDSNIRPRFRFMAQVRLKFNISRRCLTVNRSFRTSSNYASATGSLGMPSLSPQQK